MKTKLETITPAVATKYLKQNLNNRSVSQARVALYALDMKNGKWGVTHQGIAFDEKGTLIDGQQRLHAIISAGVSVQMLVTRDIPVKINGNGVCTMDVVDMNRPRSVANQLQIMHGMKNAALAAAAARSIVIAANDGKKLAMSVATTLPVLSIYEKEITEIISSLGSRACRNSSVVAVLALAAKINKQKALAFADGLSSGEGLVKGNPILTLREHILSNGTACKDSMRIRGMEITAHAVEAFFNGRKLGRVRAIPEPLNWILGLQASNIETIRKIIRG